MRRDEFQSPRQRFFERNNKRAALVSLSVVVQAQAIPPPPPAPPLIRNARMTATITLIEARNRLVSDRKTICKVTGKIPVYAVYRGASSNTWEIAGCKMRWNGKNLSVSVQAAKAISKDSNTYVVATVSVVPPGAVPLCPQMCAPQPLADSRADIRVSGVPKSIGFSLSPNPVSILNAKPTVWLEADVEIVD